jgi:hypothetical protein
MDESTVILQFSQSEKIKAGLIWASQCLQVLSAPDTPADTSGLRVVQQLVGGIWQEIHLILHMGKDPVWAQVEKDVDMALVMLNSGVAQEAGYHLTRALSKVTGVGGRSMSYLREKGLLE